MSTKTPERIDQAPEIIVPDVPAPVQEPPVIPRSTTETAPRTRRRPPVPAQSTPVPAQTAPPQAQPAEAPQPQPAKVPRLTPLISEDQRRSFDNSINAMIARARQNIAQARSRNLNDAQKGVIARAESFIAQAEEIRHVDPEAAQSLAERAELLSRELVTGQ